VRFSISFVFFFNHELRVRGFGYKFYEENALTAHNIVTTIETSILSPKFVRFSQRLLDIDDLILFPLD